MRYDIGEYEFGSMAINWTNFQHFEFRCIACRIKTGRREVLMI